MPTYEYECTACGHAFERFQSIKAAPIRKCPECGKSKVKRLIGMGAGLLFKGSGFYITDYRPDAYNKAAKADSAPAAGGEAKPAADGQTAAKSDKGEAKPSEIKAEAKPAQPTAEPKPAASKEPKAARNKKS